MRRGDRGCWRVPRRAGSEADLPWQAPSMLTICITIQCGNAAPTARRTRPRIPLDGLSAQVVVGRVTDESGIGALAGRGAGGWLSDGTGDLRAFEDAVRAMQPRHFRTQCLRAHRDRLVVGPLHHTADRVRLRVVGPLMRL